MSEEITVKVGHKFYPTVLDQRGVQRFKENSLLRYLVDKKIIDLNRVCMDYQCGNFDQVHYAEFMMMIGYSVCGFCDLKEFHDMEVINPLWEEKTKHGK
jgi:hypothetical protein